MYLPTKDFLPSPSPTVPLTEGQKNILALAEFVESARFKFDMTEARTFLHCGSAGCIGGHAAVLWRELRNTDDQNTFSWISGDTSEKLGVSPDTLDRLFFPDCYDLVKKCQDVTRSQAVSALRHLAATGEVKFT